MVSAAVQQRCASIQQTIDQANGLDWLSPEETVEMKRWRNARRRHAWLAGRWLTKQIICENQPKLKNKFSDLCILSTDEQGRSVRPSIRVRGRTQTWAISISHSDTHVLVAMATRPGIGVGVDLCSHHAFSSRNFLEMWFTKRERVMMDVRHTEKICRIWAAKESVYKAYNRGEPFAPRRIEVWWNQDGATCRYDNYEFGSELQLTSSRLRGHTAVTAVLGP